MKLLISLSAAKGSVRMTAERIKQLLVKRKAFAARLAKVKRPTDKTKNRIVKNGERIASLTVKLKTASKKKKSVPDKTTKKKTDPTSNKSRKRPTVATPVTVTKVKTKPTDKQLKNLSKIAENRVGLARKEYTAARLDKKFDPQKLAGLKTKYQDAFRSYMRVGRKASQSSSVLSASGTSNPGRYDPIVLAYNHLMGISLATVSLSGGLLSVQSNR